MLYQERSISMTISKFEISLSNNSMREEDIHLNLEAGKLIKV
jgi:hypothetical protein